ncbi:hypothetical protein EK21DRAFT_115667 [Setomelanomma holmii]|uniref:DNA2/NAM7 helicase-like C-terminal domain-containing protein n=1 Tax=Setomelanomma holmii TaxID=210430 RepID=A0A9P4LJH5_9PLEO|nr:hypothetical protein EK21DRAFT_115667 [Setomelanomma holmii]
MSFEPTKSEPDVAEVDAPELPPLKTAIDDAERRLIRQFFKRLGKGKRNLTTRRTAIDIPTKGIKAQTYADTKLPCHPKEARYIADLVRKILIYRPTFSSEDQEAGRAYISPHNISIVTPYEGQQRRMLDMLLEKGKDSLSSQVAVVVSDNTSWSPAANDIEIEFISLCDPDPHVPTKVEQEKAIALASLSNALYGVTSRARYYQVITGNFRTWLEAGIQAATRGPGPVNNIAEVSKDTLSKREKKRRARQKRGWAELAATFGQAKGNKTTKPSAVKICSSHSDTMSEDWPVNLDYGWESTIPANDCAASFETTTTDHALHGLFPPILAQSRLPIPWLFEK